MHPASRQMFEITVEHDRAATVVTLRGELDIAGVPRLRSTIEGLAGAGHLNVVVDLDDLEFCDSTGLGTFVGLHHHLDDVGGSLRLRRPCPAVQRILEITALDRLLDVAD
jgi:anti-sigma B factor antagonist